MKFDKLVKIITEAKGTKPGERFFNASNSDPTRMMNIGNGDRIAPISSSPVGKVDNLETRQPVSKWEFDPSLISGKSGFDVESKLWKSMLTSFGLLINDEYFDKQLKKISKRFKESLDSYKNIKGISEDGEIEKYDEENQLEKLERNQTKYRSDLTGLEQDLKDRRIIYNRTQLPPSEKDNMTIAISKMEAEIKTLNKLKKAAKSSKRKEEYELKVVSLVEKLNKLQTRYDHAIMGSESVEKVKASIFDIEQKIDVKTKKLEKVTEELESLYERINTINSTNEDANAKAVTAFTDLVNFTAKSLIDNLNETNSNSPMGELENINWNGVPTSFQDKINRLKSLATNDPNVNPILGYLEKFKRSYDAKDFDASRELDKNVNITKIRDRNRLPFMVLLRIYSGINISKIPLEVGVDDETHKTASNQLETFFKSFNFKDRSLQDEWMNPSNKDMLKALINDLALPDKSKDMLFASINRPWGITRSGLNSFGQLKSSIDADLKRFNVKNESFDKLVSNILLEKKWDDDDFKLDLMQVLCDLKSK